LVKSVGLLLIKLKRVCQSPEGIHRGNSEGIQGVGAEVTSRLRRDDPPV